MSPSARTSEENSTVPLLYQDIRSVGDFVHLCKAYYKHTLLRIKEIKDIHVIPLDYIVERLLST